MSPLPLATSLLLQAEAWTSRNDAGRISVDLAVAGAVRTHSQSKKIIHVIYDVACIHDKFDILIICDNTWWSNIKQYIIKLYVNVTFDYQGPRSPKKSKEIWLFNIMWRYIEITKWSKWQDTCHFYPFGWAECLSLWQLDYSLKTGVTTNNSGQSLSQANSWSIHRPLSIIYIYTYIYIYTLYYLVLSYLILSYVIVLLYHIILHNIIYIYNVTFCYIIWYDNR